MKAIHRIYIFIFWVGMIFQANIVFSQKVGLVLSGGGASGLSHIGVLKALEEYQIPIDYITGTSAGALVGAMYSVGYSPAEIEAYVLSERFQLMVNGKYEKRHNSLFYTEDVDASVIEIPFSKDSIFTKFLPLSLITPVMIDYEMLELLSVPGNIYGNNYDSLFIPFRCVAADITHKKSKTFRSGQLNQSVRASMTFPFYINPITIDEVLYFDGGLYNNFPVDVMYEDFMPDFIIGSNVSNIIAPPKEDDVMSQITSMLTFPREYSLPCSSSVVINPNTKVSTFDFNAVKVAIADGYKSTVMMIDSIRNLVGISKDSDALKQERIIFRNTISEFRIAEITTQNLNSKKSAFITSMYPRAKKGDGLMTKNEFVRNYYRSALLPQVSYIYPTLKYNASDSSFDVNLNVKKSKEFRIEFGGLFSSRPINTGYVGLSFINMDRFGYRIKAESYFGKFYSSVGVEVDFQLPTGYPISISPLFNFNRWDYYRSSNTFFEDVKPSFIVQNEFYVGAKVKFANGNLGISELTALYFDNEDDYYQTKNFTSIDITDKTFLNGFTLGYEFRNSTLNRKQFSSKGHSFTFGAKFVVSDEEVEPGTTGVQLPEFRSSHNWFHVQAKFQKYFFEKSKFRIGFHVLGAFNTQPLFANYISTILHMSSFNPLPDMNTVFLEHYRSPLFVGGGYNVVFALRKNLDLRMDIYLYEPFIKIMRNDAGSPYYSNFEVKNLTYLGGLSAIYHSPIGPFRLTANYFPKQLQENIFENWKDAYMLQVGYGFLLFNDRVLR